MITRIDPSDYREASTVQIDTDAVNPWLAIEEIENWAAQNGFVRTSEYHPRQVMVEGRRQFRGICYRISQEERLALEASQQEMVSRGDALRGVMRPLAAQQP